MSDSIVTVEMRAEALLARLLGANDRLMQNLRVVVNRLSLEVQTAVKEEKLTGQVLHVRTGTLRRSINRVVRDEAGGVVATVGTNVRYAAIHEYGYTGDVNVRSYVRRIRATSDLAPIKTKSGATAPQTGASLRSMGGGSPTKITPRPDVVTVRAHTRHVNFPERSFLRSTLREKAPEIRTELRAAVLAALRP